MATTGIGYGRGKAVVVRTGMETEFGKINVTPSTLLEIKHFLEHYKDLEPGKWVKVEGWDDANVAKEEIIKAIAMYKEKFGEKE